jgi:hypothetical protein
MWVLGLLLIVASSFSISIVALFRRNFGERYLGWINLFFGYTVVANFAFIGNLIGAGFGHGWSWLMVLCWLAFVAASIYHRIEIARKKRKGERWHTMYPGDSIIPLPIGQERMFKFVEPAIVFVLGAVIFAFSGSVGAWLMISAAALIFSNHFMYFSQQQVVLDAQDRAIEADFLSGAMQGKPAKETAGFVFADSTVKAFKRDPGLKRAFENISDEAKGLLDAPPDEDFDKAA